MADRSGTRGHPAWSWVAAALSLAYAAAALTCLAARALLWPWPGLLAALSYGGPFLFLPLLGLLPLALLSRSRIAQVAALAMVGLFLAVYLPYFLPRSADGAATGGQALRVMTFNLGSATSTAQQVVDAVAGTDADIVALQEVTPETASLLRQKLGERYPYSVLEPEQSDAGLLSRYPIVESEFFRPEGIGRVALQSAVDVDGTRMHILVVHPRPPLGRRPDGGLALSGRHFRALEEQAIDIAERAASLPAPVLVAGDLNMSDQSQAYTYLAGRFTDAFRVAGWGLGFTFPDRSLEPGLGLPPLVRIDYIFASPGVRFERAVTGCGTSSDHCFVLADAVLPD